MFGRRIRVATRHSWSSDSAMFPHAVVRIPHSRVPRQAKRLCIRGICSFTEKHQLSHHDTNLNLADSIHSIPITFERTTKENSRNDTITQHKSGASSLSAPPKVGPPLYNAFSATTAHRKSHREIDFKTHCRAPHHYSRQPNRYPSLSSGQERQNSTNLGGIPPN